MARRTRPKKPLVDSGKRCKDCPADANRRPTPYPGPRCYTCHKARLKATSAARKASYVLNNYSITDEQYWQLYEFQGGLCYICQRAKGQGPDGTPTKAKRLSVDHDHSCCPTGSIPVSCGRCVRGLLCKPCNRDVLGHLRDDPAAFERGRDYVLNPPAKRLWQLT